MQIKLRTMTVAMFTAALAVGSCVLAAEQLEQVTVQGSRVTKGAVATSNGVPVDEVTLSRHVSFGDLDLSTHSGALEMEKRINLTAEATCKELERLYPIGTGDGTSCIKRAVSGAMLQARAAIAAAEKARLSAAAK